MIRMPISAPTPDCGQPSSTVTQPPGLLHRGDDRLDVHRAERAQVDHLGLDALLLKLLRGLEGIGHADAIGDDGDVLALAVDARLADRHGEVVELRHRERLSVKNLVFEEDHRVRIADGALEQALGVGRHVGRDHLEARHVRVPGGVSPGCAGRRRGPPRRWAPEDDRAAHLSAGHVERLGGRVDDLVDRLHGEVEGHELDDRPQARERGADAEAREAVLGDRRVDDPLRAELLQQALRDLVGALVLARPPRR